MNKPTNKEYYWPEVDILEDNEWIGQVVLRLPLEETTWQDMPSSLTVNGFVYNIQH